MILIWMHDINKKDAKVHLKFIIQCYAISSELGEV